MCSLTPGLNPYTQSLHILIQIMNTHRVYKEWGNTTDVFNESVMVKQFALTESRHCLNGLTHHRLFWVTQALDGGKISQEVTFSLKLCL